MKCLSGLSLILGASLAGAGLFVTGATALGQSSSTTTQVVRVISRASKKTSGASKMRVAVHTASAPVPSSNTKASHASGLRPHSLPVPVGVTVNAADLGSSEIHGIPVTMTLNYATPSTTLTAAITAGTDFAVSASSCTTSGCSVTVVFTPVFPGIRFDAIKLTDGSGKLVYETYVHGLGKGPQMRFDLGGYNGYYSFTDNPPQTIAVGPDGTIYVTETGGNSILKLSPNSGPITSFTVTGLGSPSGIAIDGANTLYVADQANSAILSYDLASGTQATVPTSALSGPSQIAVDGTGALYVADTGNGRIIKLDNQGTETTLATGLSQPTAVAVDSAGNVYFADGANNGEIFEILAGSSQTTTLQSNVGQTPRSLVVGADGIVYLTTFGGIQRYYQGNIVGDNGADSGGPVGLALNPNGGVLFTTPGANSFTIVDPQNGANFILSSPPGVQTQGTFTVSNTGNEPLTLSNLATDLPLFTIDPSSVCQNGTVLAPQTTCTVTVDFTPPAAMDYTGHVNVTSDSLHVAGTTYQFIVYGGGTGDASHTDLTAAPSAVMVSNPVRLLATVVNDGGSNNPSGTVTFYDGDVSIRSATLAPPNEHVEITVSDLAVGTHTLTAQYSGDTLVHSDTSNTVTLVVSDGPPDPNNGISVSSYDFGTAAVGATGGTLNFSYMQNFGQAPSVQGEDYFESSPACSDGICNVTVTFRPQYPGLRQGLVEQFSGGDLSSKTLLYGIGTGPQLGFNSGTNSVYQSLAAPAAIAVSPGGLTLFGSSFNIIADTSTNQVYETTSDGTSALPILNLATPAGVAIGLDGTVYVADSTNNLIFTYNISSQEESVLATSQLSHPTGITLDRVGNLYILDTGNDRVIKMTPQGVETTVTSGVQNLASIATDSAGNVYYGTVTGENTQGVYKIPADGSQTFQVFYGEGPIHALAIDASGAFYFQNDNFTNIFAPPPQDQLLLGYQFPGNSGDRQTGLALAENGDVYATDSDSGQYFKSVRSTGNVYSFVTVGSTGNISAKVFNDGNAPLTLSAIAVSGTTFTVLSSSTCAAGVVVVPGGNCDVALKYTPTQPGENHETLTVTSNSLNFPGTTNSYDLYGEASNPQLPTTTTLTYSPSTVPVGSNVTLTATVTESTNIPPSGTVTFMEGASVLGTGNLAYQTAGGMSTATLVTVFTTQGVHTVTAVYAGDPNFFGSTSAPVTITVGAPPAIQVSSQNFGSVAVGQQSQNVVTVNLPNPGNYYGPLDGTNFVLSGSVCNQSGCMVYVYFKPNTPGLKTDSIVQKDANGNVVARAFLYGVGTGPQFGFLPGSSSIDTTYTNPTSITFDPEGVGYVTDAVTDKVYPLYTGAQPLPIAGLGRPGGIALDGGGTFYIADRDNNVVRTFNRYTNIQGTLPATGLNNPNGVAVDGLGNVYVADTGMNRIVEVSNQGVQSALVSFANTPQAVAVDSANNIYYSSLDNNGQIIEIPAAGGSPVTIASVVGGTPQGIAVDASGSVYYVGNTFSGIRDVLPGGAGQVAFSGQNTGGHGGIGINFNGDLWTTQDSNGVLESLHRATISNSTTTPPNTIKSHTVQVVNTGNAPLTLSNVALEVGAFFSITGGNTCTNGSVLPPGAVCQTPVQFMPPFEAGFNDGVDYMSNTLNVNGSVNTDTEMGSAPGSAPATGTTLTYTPSSPIAGQPVTFTAVVSDGAQITPTGTVYFLEGSTQLGTGTLSASGQAQATATFSTSSLPVGSHSINAAYTGDSNVASSSSITVTVIVNAPQSLTTTVLSISSGTVAYESPVTFTASVFDTNNAPITVGQVIFCDAATQARCNLTNNFAIVQLTSAGTAVVKFAPGSIRNHSYVAKFIGTTSVGPSTSTDQSVVVTGTYPTVTTLASIGNPGAYNLTATVVGTGTSSASPSGAITFTDTINSNPTLGTATLGAGTAAFSEKQPSGSPVTVGNGPYGVATGDFNGDGIPDVVFENYNAGTVSVLLGNGNGTFQSAVTYAVGTQPERVMVADFNGDGKFDLVVANTGSNTISILLGNGDGTFQPQVTYSVASPVGLGVMDLNHDGIPDIAAASYYANEIGILIGNGDGTFKAVTYYPTASTPQSLAEGDFNNDGNIDIVTGNVGAANLSIFIGNGDGTFQTRPTFPLYAQPQGIAVGDFNEDGIPDLAVTSTSTNSVGTLLGQGDGTFSSYTNYFAGNAPVGVVVADFNGDGHQDISVDNTGSATQSVLIGAGNGTFNAQITYATGNFPYGTAVADFNGDGLPDIAVSNFNDNTGTVLLSTLSETATAMANGINVPGSGTHQVVAPFPGDTSFSASISAAVPLMGGSPLSTTTTLAVSSNNVTTAQSVTLTATIAGQASPALSGAVTFFDGATSLGTGNVTATSTGGTATFVVPSFTAGSHSVTAQYSGDTNYSVSTSSAQTITVTRAPAVVTSKNFGSVAVGQSVSMNITYTQGTNPTITAVNNLDFVVSTVNCSTGCVATVTFVPQFPGTREDAVTVTDSQGNLLTKTFVYGVGTGPQFAFDIGLQGTPISLTAPGPLAVGPDGTYYVADTSTNTVKQYTANGVVTVPTGTLGAVAGVAVDGAGTVYISDPTRNLIVSSTAAGVVSTVPATLSQPSFLAVDGTGALYVLDNGYDRIYKIDNQGNQTTVGTSAQASVSGGFDVDAADNVFYADGGHNGEVTEFGVYNVQNLNLSIYAVAVDAADRVYLTSIDPATNRSAVSLFTAGATATVNYPISNATQAGAAIRVDQAGSILVSEPALGRVDIYNRSAGNISSLTASAGSTAQGTVTISNTGNTALTLGSLAVTGSGFSLGTGGTCAVNGSVAPASSCTVVVTFAPTAAQSYTGTLTVGSNSLNSSTASNAFTFNGTGTAAQSTTTTLAVSSNAVNAGQSVTLTATVTFASSQPTGTVNFFDGTTMIGSSTLGAGSGGTATAQFTTSSLALGSHSLTAMYAGNGTAPASVSVAQSVVVSQASTTTALGVSAATITVGQAEMLTATIAGGASPVMGGMVTFFDGTVSLGSNVVTATTTGGTASITAPNLSVGSHSMTARYSGDTNYIASTSTAQTVTVGQATSITTLGISAANITAAQSETLTATVTGLTSPAITGNVTFFDGTTSLGNGTLTVTGSAGTASLTVPSLSVGSHSITARYNADTNYTASTSAAQTVTVGQITSTTVLGISAASINAGQPETLTATIAGAASPVLGGVVTFFDGTTSIGTGSVTSTGTGGTATLTVTALSAGTRSLTAHYGGDTNYAASVSGAQTVIVSGNSQTITFPAIPNHVFGDAPFALTATASSGLPVSYTVVSGPATVSGSTVTLTGSGTVVIQATQAGNATYAAATPVSQSFTVGPNTLTLTSLTPAGAVIGASATTVTLTGTNFSTTDTIQINATGVATTFVNATTLTAVIPASSLTAAATLQVTVFDSASGQTSAAQTFTVSATPSVIFTGPSTTPPAAQPTVNVVLTNPYPVALTTTLTLTFAPATTTLSDDPNIQFATGGRTETFVIPANSTITPAILLQSGTVAGKITVTLTLTNPAGVNVTPANVTPVVITIPAIAPAISTAAVARSGNTLTVTIHAFSNTREVTKAIFHFTAAPGSTIDTPDITADVSAVFATWFSSTVSQQYGSSFTYSQNFNLNNDSSTIGSVTVTLVNTVGTSIVTTAQ